MNNFRGQVSQAVGGRIAAEDSPRVMASFSSGTGNRWNHRALTRYNERLIPRPFAFRDECDTLLK
jgi:hypothetical protein